MRIQIQSFKSENKKENNKEQVMKFRKIEKEEFDKLKRLFPVHGDWEKYKKQQLERIYKNELDVFIIEIKNVGFIAYDV